MLVKSTSGGEAVTTARTATDQPVVVVPRSHVVGQLGVAAVGSTTPWFRALEGLLSLVDGGRVYDQFVLPSELLLTHMALVRFDFLMYRCQVSLQDMLLTKLLFTF